MLSEEIKIVEEDIRVREEKLELAEIEYRMMIQDYVDELHSRKKQLAYLKQVSEQQGGE